ncbi:DJ-1 family glyoxalase III [Atopobacter sp. AH10]|uniref:DJ-1 family glyoxalase III n=1 Tax=Atopobacter sp. AH10 TaxID=2315861 RepID=UPI001314C60F|nr:DJ-1 family glyoxalase III [Atopobacter sp. AH10]
MVYSLGVLLADGFETIEALLPVDVFRRAGEKVVLLSTNGKKEVLSAQGVTIKTDALMEELDPKDLKAVFLPGGMGGAESLRDNLKAREFIQEVYANEGLVAAICAGPIVLEKAGLLKETHFTAFPGLEEKYFEGLKPEDQLVVLDKRILTSRGPAPAFPFALALLATVSSPIKAEAIYQAMQGPMVFPAEKWKNISID